MANLIIFLKLTWDFTVIQEFEILQFESLMLYCTNVFFFSGHSHGGGEGHGHSHGTDSKVKANKNGSHDSNSLLQKSPKETTSGEEYDENNPVWEINQQRENGEVEKDPDDIVIEFDEKRLCKLKMI